VIVSHFPASAADVRYGGRVPRVGDVRWRDGERWQVTSVARRESRFYVTLCPAAGDTETEASSISDARHRPGAAAA
jgi:hypothetical protein